MGSATTPTTVSTATMPTSMTDAEATRLGLKVYSHGVTYTGSPNSPTITLTGGGGTLSSITYSHFLPYQIQDGTYRLRMSFRAFVSSTARTTASFAIAGVAFPALDQPLAGNTAGAAPTTYVVAASSTVVVGHSSSTTDTYMISGDVALASKPTWAY